MLSIVIPTYNEAEIIEETISRVFDSLGSEESFELIIVDDDSSDGTPRIVRDFSDNYIQLITRTEKKGLASAILRGFRESEGDKIIVMDADLQHPPEKIPELVTKIEKGIDVVIGSRYTSKGEIRDWSLKRKIISKGATLLSKILLPPAREIKDPISGFFALRKEVIKNIRWGVVGPKILLDILVKARYERVKEEPYRFTSRQGGKSKFRYEKIFQYILQLSNLFQRVHER